MSRRSSKYAQEPRPLRYADETSTIKVDGRWITRTLANGQSVKEYRCPGCEQLIRPGVAHVVVWPHLPPIGSISGVAYRRHWHITCWRNRP